MLFFVLFGTKGVTSTKGRGSFFCPQCSGERQYKHQHVRRFFTLFFIPLIPLDELGNYVECQACTGTYKPEVLSFDPTAERRRIDAEFHGAIKVVMIHMLLADGEVEDAEIEAIGRVIAQLSGKEPDMALLREQVGSSAVARRNPVDVAHEVAGTLNVAGKEMVIRAAITVALADGVLAPKESKLLMELAGALELSGAHVKGLLMEAGVTV
jgi:uncharacterized tellurite resistance protein B-like protein